MPFDGTNFAPIAVPVVKPFDFDTATPDERLLELARLLDNDKPWRNVRMEWDFRVGLDHEVGGCGTAGCALGLAQITWPGIGFRPALSGWDHDSVDAAFDLGDHDGIDLFGFGLAENLDLRMSQITPGMVATAIREFVAKRSPASPVGERGEI